MTTPSGFIPNQLPEGTEIPPLNPGKSEAARAGYRPAERGIAAAEGAISDIMRVMMDDNGPGSNLLNVMPIVGPETINLGRRPIGGITDAVGSYLSPEEAEGWRRYTAARDPFNYAAAERLHATPEGDQLARALARRVNRVVNDSFINVGQVSYTHEEMTANLTRNREEQLRRMIDHAHTHLYQCPASDPVSTACYQGRPLASYTEEEWEFIVRTWRYNELGHPHPGHWPRGYRPPEGEGVPANIRWMDQTTLLAARRQAITRRVNQIGMSVEEQNMVSDGDRLWGGTHPGLQRRGFRTYSAGHTQQAHPLP